MERALPGVAGAILCGGNGSRLGTHKPMAKLGGEPLLSRAVRTVATHVRPLVIVHRETERGPREDLARALIRGLTPVAEAIAEADPLGKESTPGPLCEAIEDRSPHRTPLAGIEAALAWSPADAVFVCAVDMPFVAWRPLLERMLALSAEADLVVPTFGGELQPLCAIYRKACLPHAQALLAAGPVGPRALYDKVRTKVLDYAAEFPADPAGRPFLDADTPEELAKLERMLRG